MDGRNDTITDGTVAVGSTVTIQDGALREVWEIVGPEDADPFANRLNAESSLARALLGRRAGDEAAVRGRVVVILDVAPGGA
jgi:transcription elongation GreA/GreB family factor